MLEELSFEQLLYLIVVIGLIGSTLTFARRWENPDDSEAGMAPAGWTIVLIIIIVIETLL